MKKTLFSLFLSGASFIMAYAQPACSTKGDFSFSRNPCSPFDISFSTNATGYNTIRWAFGDAGTATGTPNPSHTYAALGNYTVSLIVNYPTCADTITKSITLDLQTDNQLIQTRDTLICYGTTKQIVTTPGLSFCWSPATGLDNPASSNPVASPQQTTTYYYNALTAGNNLITNGDFSQGNTGFTSQYFYTSSNTTEGEYYVGTNPSAWYPAHYGCSDHTTGSGNMLLVNGSPTPDVEVWKTTVNVTPNTNYAFSTWICSISVPNPAQLAFSINGNSIGGLIVASQPPCNWVRFYTTWNSGTSTSAVISIINKNTIAFGNDFALDDISFAPFSFKRDSVIITVENPDIQSSPDQQICAGKSVQLNTTGASQYNWTPGTGLSSATIANPVASPTVSTTYYVTGTTVNNCSARDTVFIDVNPIPVVSITPDTSVCQNGSIQLIAAGGDSYIWTPAASLNNPAIPDPVASPLSSTKYFVKVTSAAGCENTDSVNVLVRTTNGFFANPVNPICEKQSVQLNSGGGNKYLWQPASGLSDPSSPTPVASPVSTTQYDVIITDTVCNASRTFSTTVTVHPLPLLTVAKSNDIDCTTDNSQLTVTGATTYSWSPSTWLSDSTIANPISTPADTITYYVTGTDINGCENNTSITVNVTSTGKSLYLMPTAFTPNGDGLNDCYGIRYWGSMQHLDFSIYNRWGERVFHTTNPAACWDGRHRGVMQDAGIFVYVIRAKTLCGDAFKKGTFALIK